MAGAIFILTICFYFVPTLVAWCNDHKNTAGIVILNLFLGWTLVGWVVALVWAVTNAKAKP